MGRILPAMKYETYSQYNPLGVAHAESAFLSVWAGLGSWHSDLVLVGGLVPKYLCGDQASPRTLPRPADADTDRHRAGCVTLANTGASSWIVARPGISLLERRVWRPTLRENGG